MRVIRATALIAGVLAVPAASAAATIPDLSKFPIARPGRISPEEMQRELAKIPKLPARPQMPVSRLNEPGNLRVVDDVLLFEVEACEEDPGFQVEEEPTCGVYFSGTWGGGFDVYGYTWQTTILGKQILQAVGDGPEVILLFNQYPTEDTGGAFFMPIFSDVSGIGTSRFDFRDSFGNPESKLRGLVSMNNWWNCDWLHWSQDGCTDEAPWPTTFRSLHGVLGQEIGHQWGAFMRFENELGNPTRVWLGRDDDHWSYWLNSGGSPLEGNHWVDDGDGNFHIEHVPYTKFSDLDLYTMGLLPPAEVEPTWYIRPENCTTEECRDSTPPETGRLRITGERVDVTIDQVIAAMGERSPSFAESPRFHRELFVFSRIVGQDEAMTEFGIEKIGRIRRYWNEYFYEATRHRMRAITTIDGRDDYPRFEWAISDEGWSAFGNAGPAEFENGMLVLTADASGSVGARNENVRVETGRYPTLQIRAVLPESAAGRKIRVTFGGLDGVYDETNAIEVEPIADGVARTYGVDLRNNVGWTGSVGALRVELMGAGEGETFALDRLRFTEEVYADRDADGILDEDDNCVEVANEDQADADGNSVGDLCQDDDNDTVPNVRDNCPTVANSLQSDTDGDGIGDACEDSDGDGVLDPADNCRAVANPDQADADGDRIGDACEETGGTDGPGDGDGSPGKTKKKDGGCTSAAALPTAAGFLIAGLALARRRRD